MPHYLDGGAYAIQEAQLFHLEQIQANRTDVENQPPVTSIPAFTRCCQARLEKQFNTEINLLSHLHPTIVIKDSRHSTSLYGFLDAVSSIISIVVVLSVLFTICSYLIQMGRPRSPCELSVFELLTCPMKKKSICLVLADTLISPLYYVLFHSRCFFLDPSVDLSLLGSLELFFS